MDDEDEDVLFENSPLHQHLKDSGIEYDIQHRIQHLPTPQTKQVSEHWLKKVTKDIISSLSVMLRLQFLCEDLTILADHFKSKAVKIITSSKILDEDDSHFLENFVRRENSEEEPVVRPKLLFVLALPCVLAYLHSRIMYPDLPWQFSTLTDLMACLCLVYLVFIVGKFCLLYNKKRKYAHYTRTLEGVVREATHFCKLLKKSLRLIQESELVARGFTLVSHQSAVWRLEQNNTQRQCPQLRSVLFHSARQTMLIAKDKTLHLLENYPLSADIDSILHHLANVPLVEYGLCLQLEGDNSELYSVTDGFSVAALKGMKQLCEMQVSELFRRIGLTLYHTDKYPDSLDDWIKSLSEELNIEIRKLQRSYDGHSCFVLENENKKPRPNADNKHSLLRDVYLTVHSLDLHLQAAWLRVKSLSSLLEQQVDHVEDNAEVLFEEEMYEKLKQQIKHELLACKACWEEGLVRLDRLGKQPEKTAELSPSDITSSAQDQHLQPSLPLIDMGDPVIEDQVFEAYTEEEAGEDNSNTWDEFLTPEEKERRKREKQEAVRVLTELRSVISVRATDREHRERVALEKAANKLKDNQDKTFDTTKSDASESATSKLYDSVRSDESKQNTSSGSVDSLGYENPVAYKPNTTETNTNIDTSKSQPEEAYTCTYTDANEHTDSKKINACTQKEVINDADKTDISTTQASCKQCENITGETGQSSRCQNIRDDMCHPSICSTGDLIDKSDTSEESIGVRNTTSNGKGFVNEFEVRNSAPVYETDVNEQTVNGDQTNNTEDNKTFDELNCDLEIIPTVYHRYRKNLDTDHPEYSDSQLERGSVGDRLSQFSGANMTFTSNLAALAAARSHSMGVSMTTIGDDMDDDDVDDTALH